jgi:N-acetyl-anhydromuramyl-L-alanine amidase AmpD
MPDAAVADAVRRSRLADQLNGDGGDDADSEDAAAAEEDRLTQEASGTTEEPETTQEPVETTEEEPAEAAPAPAQNPNAQSVSDYLGAAPSPTPAAVRYPTITSEGEPYVPPAATSRANAYLTEGESLLGPAPKVSDQSILEEPSPNPNAQSVQDYLTEGESFTREPGTLFSMAGEGYVSPTEEAAMAAQAKGPPVEVRRGELVGLPPEQGGFPVAGAPAAPPEVRRAQMVPGLTTDYPVANVPPEAAAQAVVGAAQPAVPVNPNAQSVSDYLKAPPPTVAKAQPAGAAQPIQKAQISTAEPEVDHQAERNSFQPYNGDQPRVIKNIILHSTDGEEKGSLNTLTTGGVSAHYLTTRDGRSYHLVNDNDIAYHAGKTINPDQYSNGNTIGIEQVHIDGQPWDEAEVKRTALTVAQILQRHPELSINNVLGHSDIAPERKQDPLNFPWDRFRGYVAQYMGQQPTAAAGSAPGAPQAQPVTKGATGFYQNEDPKTFFTGKATTFATPSDVQSGQDSGVGAPRLGRLDTTNVAGIAVPEEQLQAQLGNNPAAWRMARIDVVDPTSGKRLRLPIVDLGPSAPGASIDMTPFVSSYFGGDKNLVFKLVPKAGPDVTRQPGLWQDEQAAIKQGFDSSSVQRGVQKIQGAANYVLGPALEPAQLVALQQADQYAQQGMRDTLSQLPEAQAVASVHKYLRPCDLCKELAFGTSTRK